MSRRLITAALAALAITASVIVAVSVSRSAEAESAAGEYTNIMPLGDSLTLGITATGWNSQGKPKFVSYDGYRKDLWKRLHDNARIKPNFVGSCPRQKFLPFKCTKGKGTMDDYNHEGHSGFRAHQLSAFSDEWMSKYRPKIVLLMVGTNDLCAKCDREHAPDRLSYLIDKVRKKLPKSGHLFVATIPQRRDAGATYVNAYNDAVPGVVSKKKDKRLHLVPQHLVGEEAQDLSVDKIHPSACGYAKISFVWYYTMNRYLPGDWPLGKSPFEGHGACA